MMTLTNDQKNLKSEHCMYCGFDFDPKANRYTDGSISSNRSNALEFQFSVRCPNCGIAFISENLKAFGLFSYDRLWIAYLLFIIVAGLTVWLANRWQ